MAHLHRISCLGLARVPRYGRGLMPLAVLWLAATWAAAPALGQDALADEMPAPAARVIKLTVEGAPDEAARDAVIDIIGIAEGDSYDPEAIRLGVKRVFLTGPWADVRVYGEPVPGGIHLMVQVRADQVISFVELTTTGAIPKDRLRSAVPLNAGDRFREDVVREAELILREACQQLGYPRALVKTELDEVEPNVFRVRFDVDEGQPARVRGLKLKGVSGNAKGDVLALLGLKTGERFDRFGLERGLDRVVEYLVKSRHLRAEVEVVDLEAFDDGLSVDLAIRVAPGPRYRVDFVGNDSISRAFLLDDVNERSIGRLDDTALDRAERSLLRYYRRAGFARASVTFDEVPAYRPFDDDADRILRFIVDEGPRIKVREIVVEGARAKESAALEQELWDFVRAQAPQTDLLERVDSASLRELLGSSAGKPKPRPGQPTESSLQKLTELRLAEEPPFLEELFLAASDHVADIYRTEGFLDVTIHGPEPIYIEGTNEVRVRYRIVEGPQLLVAGVRFTPAPTLPLSSLLAVATFEPGKPANLYAIEETRVLLEKRLQQEGFPFAKVTESLSRNAALTEADVVFILDEGPRIRVGDVLIRGNERTRRFVIEDQLSFDPGEWYRAADVEASRQRLLRMGLFSSVSIELARARPDRMVRDVVVHVRERPQFALETGVGASIEQGPRAYVSGEVRNILGLGFGLRGRTQVNYPFVTYGLVYDDDDENHPNLRARRTLPQAPLLYHVEGQGLVTLEIPKVYGVPFATRFHLDGVGLREIRPAFTLIRGSAVAGLESQPFGWWRTGVELEAEASDFDCPTLDIGGGCGQGSIGLTRRLDAGFIRQTTIRMQNALDFRDDPFRPRSGVLLSTTADFAVGSGVLRTGQEALEPEPVNSDFIKLSGTASGYIPLAENFTFAMSVRGGNIFPVISDDNYVPLYKRFYLGGTSSVRGFFFDQILPADDPRWPADQRLPKTVGADETIVFNSLGGNFFVNTRSELRIGLVGELDLGLFIDSGQLLQDVRNFSITGFAAGAGVGVRYNTPVGPFAADVGWQVLDGQRQLSSLASLDRVNLHFSIGYF